MTIPAKCRLRFPHHQGPLTPQQMKENYLAFERFIAVFVGDEICLCAGCVEINDNEATGAPTPPDPKCLPHIPHKSWREEDGWRKDAENLSYIERFWSFFVRNCGCDVPELEQPT
jgi:hypothetical protein